MRTLFPAVVSCALACSGTGAPPAADVVLEPSACAGASCAQGSEGPAAPACLAAGTSSCDAIVGGDELAKLDVAVAAADKRVLDGKFQDPMALVDRARLQLRRDGAAADNDGKSDAERAKKNAMRAIAVAGDLPEARFVLALALARSLEPGRPGSTLSDPETRAFALMLVEMPLGDIPDGAGPVSAAASTLAGYVALERGDEAAARAAFERATKLDPGLGSAWMGLGDLERSASRFDAAKRAYENAAARLPSDPGPRRALAAADRGERLDLPARAPVPSFDARWGPLAPAAQPATCAPNVASDPKSVELCKAMASIAAATTQGARGDGAAALLDSYSDSMRALCQSKDPSCGPHVARGLASASRALRGHAVAKSISVAKLLIARQDELPGSADLAREISLELGDAYYTLAILDQAAEHYAAFAEVAPKGAEASRARERALAARLMLGQASEARLAARAVGADLDIPAKRRAEFILAVASLARLRESESASKSFLAEHAAVVAAEGGASASTPTSKAGCATNLACAVRRLAGEDRWLAGPRR